MGPGPAHGPALRPSLPQPWLRLRLRLLLQLASLATCLPRVMRGERPKLLLTPEGQPHYHVNGAGCQWLGDCDRTFALVQPIAQFKSDDEAGIGLLSTQAGDPPRSLPSCNLTVKSNFCARAEGSPVVLSRLHTSPTTCCRLCMAQRGCKSWTLDATNASVCVCYLQTFVNDPDKGHAAVGCTSGVPSPRPSPPIPDSVIQCLVHQVAYEQSDTLLRGRGNAQVFAALNLSHCPNATELAVGRLPPFASSPTASSASAFFVSPTGDDSNAGTTSAKPFKTLQRAQRAVRDLGPGPESRAGAVVNLMAGTHMLASSLVLTGEDGGVALGGDVVWQSAPGAEGQVVVSGGQALQCQWEALTVNGNISAYKCDTGAVADFRSLFVGGLRQVRARYPNGDPLMPKSGYMYGGKPGSQWNPVNEALPKNTRIMSQSGTLISTGPSLTGANITVCDTIAPRTLNNCKQDQTVYKNTRCGGTTALSRAHVEC